MSSYLEDFRDYFRFHPGLIPGILICIIVALVSYILTRGTLWEGGFWILPAELFSENPVFYLLSKVGPIVLALVICIFINVKKFDAGGAYAGKYILRIAIILMGARVTYDVLMTGSLVGLIIILRTQQTFKYHVLNRHVDPVNPSGGGVLFQQTPEVAKRTHEMSHIRNGP